MSQLHDFLRPRWGLVLGATATLGILVAGAVTLRSHDIVLVRSAVAPLDIKVTMAQAPVSGPRLPFRLETPGYPGEQAFYGVSESTLKIQNVEITEGMRFKQRMAQTFQAPPNGREDPLALTDRLPKEVHDKFGPKDQIQTGEWVAREPIDLLFALYMQNPDMVQVTGIVISDNEAVSPVADVRIEGVKYDGPTTMGRQIGMRALAVGVGEERHVGYGRYTLTEVEAEYVVVESQVVHIDTVVVNQYGESLRHLSPIVERVYRVVKRPGL